MSIQGVTGLGTFKPTAQNIAQATIAKDSDGDNDGSGVNKTAKKNRLDSLVLSQSGNSTAHQGSVDSDGDHDGSNSIGSLIDSKG